MEFSLALINKYKEIRALFSSRGIKRVSVSQQRFYINTNSFSTIREVGQELNKLFYPLVVSVYMENHKHYSIEQYVFYYAIKYNRKELVQSIYEKYCYSYCLLTPYVDCKANYIKPLFATVLEGSDPLLICLSNVKRRRQILNLLLSYGEKLTSEHITLIHKQGYEIIKYKAWPKKSVGKILFKL